MTDEDPTAVQFELPTGLTQVRVIDFNPVQFLNFEADIDYPEEEGIIQVEVFGMHLRVDGSVFYGMKIEAIQERQNDNLSIDHMARLLVDVHCDSSKIMQDLMTPYQRAIMDTLFLGDTLNRGKFNLILAASIDPVMPAAGFMDRGEYENELKQILGDLYVVKDLSETDVLIRGRNGVLVAGPNYKAFEAAICSFLSLQSRDMFISYFFARLLIVDNELVRARGLIRNYYTDPSNIERIRNILNTVARDVVLMKETLTYLQESLTIAQDTNMDYNPLAAGLVEALALTSLRGDITLRVTDIVKLVEGAENELTNLSGLAEVINTTTLESVFKSVKENTK